MKWREWNGAPPKVGDTRQRVRFAWIPVTTSDGWNVWLERYLSTEQFFEGRFSGAHFWLEVGATQLREASTP